MRDPNNLIKIPSNSGAISVLKIDYVPDFDIEDYDLFDTKDFKKYINDIEACCRRSFEYKRMIKYFRENMDMNQCSFYENVNNIETSNIKIHIHHDPFSLYDIAIAVFNKRVAYQESLNVELVSKEVIYLHYKLLVGLIPLSETVHELIHNNYLFVPCDLVLGDFNTFFSLYEPYIPPEQKEVLERIRQLTYTAYHDNSILESKQMYVEASGCYKLPSLDELKNKIENIVGFSNNQAYKDDEYDNNKLISPVTFI